MKQSSWTKRHLDQAGGASRADRRRRGERGPKVLPPEPVVARPTPPAPVSAWCQWRRKLMVLLLGLLMAALFGALLYATNHRPEPTSGVLPTLKSYALLFDVGQGPLMWLDLHAGAAILGFLHVLGMPACIILPYYLRPKRYDHWFKGEGSIGDSVAGTVGTGLIYLSCILMMFLAYSSLVNWIWEALGGYVVHGGDIPSARSGKKISSIASSYRSGENFGIVLMVGALCVTGAVLRKRR